MPTIRPVSDLRNYPVVLQDVEEGSPVYLTKNGRGVYALMTMEDFKEYEKIMAANRLMEEIRLAEIEAEEQGWLSVEEVKDRLEKRRDAKKKN